MVDTEVDFFSLVLFAVLFLLLGKGKPKRNSPPWVSNPQTNPPNFLRGPLQLRPSALDADATSASFFECVVGRFPDAGGGSFISRALQKLLELTDPKTTAGGLHQDDSSSRPYRCFWGGRNPLMFFTLSGWFPW